MALSKRTQRYFNEKKTFKSIVAEIPKSVSLIYVDRDTDFDDCKNELQRCVNENALDALYELADEWYDTYDEATRVVREAAESVDGGVELLDIRPNGRKGKPNVFIESYEDRLRTIVYERDDSDYMKDILRNTGKQVWFYELGIDAPEYGVDEEDVESTLLEICRVLCLNPDDVRERLSRMIAEASYGGRVVIYFTENVEDLIGDFDTVKIWGNDVSLAIIDTFNGSGSHTEVKIPVPVMLPLDRDNLYLCKNIKYSYTYNVCGMGSDWCNGTNFALLKTGMFNELGDQSDKIKSPLRVSIEQDKMFDTVYKGGGCSLGDMDINRHRSIIYVNEYPCGNRCKDCGTFWID